MHLTGSRPSFLPFVPSMCALRGLQHSDRWGAVSQTKLIADRGKEPMTAALFTRDRLRLIKADHKCKQRPLKLLLAFSSHTQNQCEQKSQRTASYQSTDRHCAHNIPLSQRVPVCPSVVYLSPISSVPGAHQ